jgi:hypothetical protein
MCYLLTNTGRYVTDDLSLTDSLPDAHAFHSPTMALRVAYAAMQAHPDVSDISVQDVTTHRTIATAWRSLIGQSFYS